jgi:hypothetical protein
MLTKKSLVLLFALTAAGGASAATALPSDCAALSRSLSGTDNNFRPPLSGTVIGKGRLHFHTAPSTQCAQKDVFIIPGDDVTVYQPHKGWYEVMFLNGKTGEDFEGWIDADRVRLSDSSR